MSRLLAQLSKADKAAEPSRDAKISLKDDYLVVALPVNPPAHVDPVLSKEEKEKLSAYARALRVRAPVSGKAGGRVVKSVLNYTSTFSTAAGTDNTTVVSIRPDNSTEFATFANLFDELIVDSGRLDFTQTITTNFTTNNGATRAVVCFDPLDAAVLGSLSNGLQHQQHLQYMTNNGATGTNSSMLATNRDGICHFKWKTPRGTARAQAAPALYGHDWSSTGDAGDLYGYLKWFIPTTGATGVFTVYYTWTLNVRFRCRT